MQTRPAPIDRILGWFRDRENETRLCAYGTHTGEISEPRCTEILTLAGSTSAGHRGYCSVRHETLGLTDRI